jgi:hypothetical protein
MAEEARQRGDVLAMDLDELQPTDLAMHGLDQRALAHAPRAPQERVVGGKAAGEALRIGKERVAHPADALQERKRQAIDVLDGEKAFRLGLPNEGVVAFEVGRIRLAWGKTLDRPGNPLDKPRNRLLKVHVAPVAKAIEVAIVAPPSRDRGPVGRPTGPYGRGRPSLSQAKDRSNDRYRLRSSRPRRLRLPE